MLRLRVASCNPQLLLVRLSIRLRTAMVTIVPKGSFTRQNFPQVSLREWIITSFASRSCVWVMQQRMRRMVMPPTFYPYFLALIAASFRKECPPGASLPTTKQNIDAFLNVHPATCRYLPVGTHRNYDPRSRSLRGESGKTLF